LFHLDKHKGSFTLAKFSGKKMFAILQCNYAIPTYLGHLGCVTQIEAILLVSGHPRWTWQARLINHGSKLHVLPQAFCQLKYSLINISYNLVSYKSTISIVVQDNDRLKDNNSTC
jgi:hypothetical protein